MHKAIWVSTYCNKAHYQDTGRPIDHECLVLPPAFIRAEMDDDFATCGLILRTMKRVTVKGRKES